MCGQVSERGLELGQSTDAPPGLEKRSGAQNKKRGARRGARLTAGLGQRPRSGLELGLELVAEEWRSALSAAPFPPSRKSSSAGSFAGDFAEAAE